METYRVRVTKDYLTFCSAHFISFEGNKRERLHGHNYGLTAEISGPLDRDFLVFDFVTLKRMLRKISDELDHRMLVAEHSSVVLVEVKDERVRLTHEGKEWVFPRDDCIILPIENTTAELLARWIADRLREEITKAQAAGSSCATPETLSVEVEETNGQSARYRWSPSGDDAGAR